MEPLKKKVRTQREELIDKIETYLAGRGWYTTHLHNCAFQMGMPHIFATHERYGVRLIDPRCNSPLTEAQKQVFMTMYHHGCFVVSTKTWDDYIYTDMLNKKREDIYKKLIANPAKSYHLTWRNRHAVGPEAAVERDISEKLRARAWLVIPLHGSTYQAGMPDLMCFHKDYGVRMLEVKDPNRKGFLFTGGQLDKFAKLNRHGCPVIIVKRWDMELILRNKSNYLEHL